MLTRKPILYEGICLQTSAPFSIDILLLVNAIAKKNEKKKINAHL
jgi:hypothetical protein